MTATLKPPARRPGRVRRTSVATRPRPRLPAGDERWTAALVVLLAATAVLMLYLTRGLTFNLDEWWVVTERRGPGAPSLLAPHNEHLTLVPLAVFLAMLEVAGLDAYWLMMLPLVGLQLTLGGLLFVIARRRLGAGTAVGVAALALLGGLAYENFLVAGQLAQMLSIVAGVAAFAVLDLPPSRRNDAALCGLLLVALASSGLGIAVAAGVTVELLLSAAGRRRLWTLAAPAALYLAWYAAYGVSRASLEDLGAGLTWAATAADYAAGALIGERGIEPGRVMLTAILVVVAFRAWRLDRAGRVRVLALATVLVTFYVLTGLSRHDLALPSSSRYLTLGLVFMLLMLVEAARGLRIGRWVPWAVLVLAWLSFGKVDGHAQALRDGRALFLERTMRLRASLGAVELLGPSRVRPDLEIAPRVAPLLTVSGWVQARAALPGNPADTVAEIERARADARAGADDTLVRAGGIALRLTTAGATACARPWPGESGPVPAGGLRLQAGDTQLVVRVRRFGEEWLTLRGPRVAAHATAEVHPLTDEARSHPYVLRVEGAQAICRL